MVRRCMPAELSQSERVIMDLLRASPEGVNSVVMAGRIGLGAGRTKELLHRLRKRGLAACTGAARYAVWQATKATKQKAGAEKKLTTRQSVMLTREGLVLEQFDTAPAHGLRGLDIAKVLGLTVDQVRTVLRSLRDKGVLATTGGPQSRWHRAAVAGEIRKARGGMASATCAVMEAARRERKRQAERFNSEAANEEFLIIRRRMVRVEDCLPLHPPGPTSVFRLAAAGVSD